MKKFLKNVFKWVVIPFMIGTIIGLLLTSTICGVDGGWIFLGILFAILVVVEIVQKIRKQPSVFF